MFIVMCLEASRCSGDNNREMKHPVVYVVRLLKRVEYLKFLTSTTNSLH